MQLSYWCNRLCIRLENSSRTRAAQKLHRLHRPNGWERSTSLTRFGPTHEWHLVGYRNNMDCQHLGAGFSNHSLASTDFENETSNGSKYVANLLLIGSFRCKTVQTSQTNKSKMHGENRAMRCKKKWERWGSNPGPTD